MKRELLRVGLATAVALTGCEQGNGNKNAQHTMEVPHNLSGNVVVKNISDFPIYLSNNPNFYNIKTKTGSIKAGKTATARCIDYSAEFPESSAIFVSHGGEAGYAYVYSGGTKTTEPKQQIEPGVDTLRAQLPACEDNASSSSSLGTSAQSADCGPLSNVRLIGVSKSGHYNAVNAGECAAVYDPNTYQTVGRIASNQTFGIVCIAGPKPVAFRVEIGDISGNTNLDETALEEFNKGAFGQVHYCKGGALPSPS